MVLHCVLLAVLAYPVAEEPLLVLCVIQGLITGFAAGVLLGALL